MRCRNLFLFSLFLLGTFFTASAQTTYTCEPNLDFELGDLSHWNFYRGTNTSVGGVATWTLSSCPPAPTLHTLKGLIPGETDFWGGFPVVADGIYSLKLGKDTTLYNADAADYHVHVPACPGGNCTFSLIYRYAVVLQDPGHGPDQQPRFEISVTDSATGAPLACNSFQFVSSSVLPGFKTSTVSPNPVYKPWTAGSLNLTKYAGKTMIVAFRAGACGAGGHWGYGYCDLNCGIFKIQTVGCAGGYANLEGPPGYAGYTWTDSLTFTAAYGSTQSVVITVPTVTTTYALIITPYPLYGCPDTLYARLVPSNMVTHPSRDTNICFGQKVRMWAGSTDILPLTYTWLPTTGVTCSTCDTTFITPPVGLNYYKVTTYNTGGCLHTDTIKINVNPAAAKITGDTSICINSYGIVSDATPGGSWSTTATIVAVGSSTGIVTSSGTLGTAIITYSYGGICGVFRTITVNPLPAPITGPPTVCVGYTAPLTDATPGGYWTSSNTSLATIGSGTGIVTGVFAGTPTITYTSSSTGCYVTRDEAVINLPGTIVGSTTVCQYTTPTYLNGTTGGTWSSSNTAVATIDVNLGTLNALTPGSTTLTYAVGSTGCFKTLIINIIPAPSPITGVANVCVGATTSLTDPSPGGTWSSSVTSVATVGTDGTVSGWSASPTNITVITYAFPTTCKSTITVTVNPAPLAINGIKTVCQGATTSLTDLTPGGNWSATANATVTTPPGTSPSIVQGAIVGTATVSYTLPTGCYATTVLTINPNPSLITGVNSLCIGAINCLSDATAGGTWSIAPPGIASIPIPTSGCVTGTTAGTATVTYKVTSTGCSTTLPVTVNLKPTTILGPNKVCKGDVITLSDATPGGSWSSLSTTVSVNSTSGDVTGLVAGTATVSYTSGSGCAATTIITVNPNPGPILGPSGVCAYTSATMSNALGGGTWSVSNTIVSMSGAVVTAGGVVGTDTITYKITSSGCFITGTIAVKPAPLPISGTTTLCTNSTTGLSDVITGGTWTSYNTAIATIDPFTGIVTSGNTAGTAKISYSLGGSCVQGIVVTVIPGAPLITGTPVVCLGLTTLLSDAGPSGTWTSSDAAIASVTSIGLVTGAGTISSTIAGTATISYTVPGGCSATKVVTVNPLPAPVTGGTDVCMNSTLTVSDASGTGVWSSSNSVVATITSLGVITGKTVGTSSISFKLASTGCINWVNVNVNPLPAPIAGPGAVCYNSTITLSDATPGGTYSTSSGNIALSGSSNEIVKGTNPAGGAATVIYTEPVKGCQIPVTIKVNPLPAPITGSANVCVADNMTMSDATPGGTWTSSGPAIIIGSSSGIVTGGPGGSATIFYTLTATGCFTTATVNVLTTPGAISGPAAICKGDVTTLSATPGPGTWVSSNTGVATITSGGIVTGANAGTSVISYTIGTGCKATKIMTVNALPSAIAGAGPVCLTDILNLTDGTPGGIWTSSNTAVATVGSLSGIVTPVSVGTTSITYDLGCTVNAPVTVKMSPAAITGPGVVCSGGSITLNNLVGPGSYTTTSGLVTITPTGPSSATITGFVSGVTAGVATISYAVGGTCYATHDVTINPTPGLTPTTLDMCQGDKVTMTTTIPGVWSTSNSSVAPITTGGLVSTNNTGTAVVTLTIPATGCLTNVPVTVNAIPAAITGPGQVCKASTIKLNNTMPGGTWSSVYSTVTVDPSTGDVTGVNAGTAIISYSLSAKCAKNVTVTVNPLPVITSGSSVNMCAGQTTTLTTTSTGGRWTTSGGLVTVGLTSGIVISSGTPGTALVNYTLPTGCMASTLVTINALPAPIAGPATVCEGTNANLTNTSVGTWTSSTLATATINVSSGVVHGVAAGTSTIVFKAATTGCTAQTVVTVIKAPAPIPAVPAVCVGNTQMLTNSVTPGTWSSANLAIGTIDPVTGLFGGQASGTVLIDYSTAAGCTEHTTVVVNPNSQIIGTNTVCVKQSTTLIDTTLGGIWSASTGNVTIGSGTGIVTGVANGTSIITYTTPKGCFATHAVTVNTAPSASGPTPLALCLNQAKAFTAFTPGGVWSSSVPAVATMSGPVATGVAYGTTIISYTLAGCAMTFPVTVNPVPAPITGNTDVCIGATTPMADITPGGTWSSSRTLMATVGLSSGVVTGMATGTSSIIYTITSTGCFANTTMNVHPNPLPIGGAPTVCEGSAITLSTGSTGGSWTTTTPTLVSFSSAFANPVVVTGSNAGVATIQYKLVATGCASTKIVTVNPLPGAITPLQICEAQTKVLTDVDPGGTWTSSTPGVATINVTTGSAFGVAAGTTMLNYTLPTGCVRSDILTVNPLPAPIVGPASVCLGNTANFTNTTLGGQWTTDDNTIALPDLTNNGDVSGVKTGTTNVNYVLSTTTGCSVSVAFAVTNKPAGITGNTTICLNAKNTFANTVTGGSWSTLNTTIATVVPTTGVVTGNLVGTTRLVYTMSSGCDTFVDINVAPLPVAYSVTGGGSPCAGSSVPVGLSSSSNGINYFLYVGTTIATGPLSGTGIPLAFGPQFVGGTYTVKGVDANNGCSSDMNGSVMINVIPKVFPTVAVTNGLGDTTVCSGASTTLTVKTSNEGTSPVYRWDINGTVVAITNAPYTYIPADGDVVTFTLTSSALCATPAIVSNKVTLKVVNPATASATLSSFPGDTICQGKSVTFTPAPIFGGASPTYTWIVNTVPVSTGPTFTYVPAEADVVYARIASTYGCLIAPSGVSNSVRMKVEEPLIPHVSVSAEPGTSIAPGQTTNLTAITENGGTKPAYQWILNGYPIAGETNANYAYTASSTAAIGHNDSLSVLVTSSGSCQMTTHQWVYVTIRNVGVKNVNNGNGEISVLPNPNNGEFTIKGTLGTTVDEEVSLELTDVLGQVVYKNKVMAKGGNINEHVTMRDKIANGMYMLSVRSEAATQVFHLVITQ